MASRARIANEVTGKLEEGLSVSQVNQAIGGALKRSFPDAFWVRGELQGFDRDAAKASTRRWGQVYFEIVEKEPGADTVKAGAKALLWGDALSAIQDKLSAASPDLRLQDGLQVKFLCEVDFYWPRASLQLKVLDADPHFTLGDMERARRELMEKLRAAGLLEQNRSTPFPRVPLGIGLITSDGSAAYHDFIQELRGSGFAFRVSLMDTRMQGADTEGDVTRALAVLAEEPDVEVIVLVRGGGSRSDLIWFDKEKIALAVARCPKPVIAGIGHEIDLSVADLVAHTSRKTPTAAAQFLVETVGSFERELLESGRTVATGAKDRLIEARRDLASAVDGWRNESQNLLTAGGEALARCRGQLAADTRRHLTLQRERLVAAPARMAQSVREKIRLHRERLTAFARECALKDPRRLLARGYSLIYAGGRLAKGIRDIHVGEFMEARLQDGLVTANVLNKRKLTAGDSQ